MRIDFILLASCALFSLGSEPLLAADRFHSYSEELEWLRLTERYFQEGRYDLAQIHVEDLLAANPLNHRALIYSAQIAFARTDYDRAEKILRRVIRIRPSRQSLQLLETVLEKQRKFSAAVATQAIKSPPEEIPEELHELASRLDPSTASETLTRLTRLENEYKTFGCYWAILAHVQRDLKRWGVALQSLKKALAIAPDDERVQTEAAKYWEARGFLDRAAEHLGYVVAIQPGNAQAAYRLARIQMRRNRADLANQTLRVREYLFPEETWIRESRDRFLAKIDEEENALFANCRQHTVGPGETLEGIAARYLGTPSRWEEIARANRDVVADADLLPVGIRIRICLQP